VARVLALAGQSATLVYPGFICRVDDAGHFLLTLHTR
jgi:hypothetical protein